MPDGNRFVHIVDAVPELAGRDEGPVLVHALDGFLDAGSAGALAARHLAGETPGRVVASFDIDAFYDYRARRPALTFAENRYQDYDTPRLVVRVQRDILGTPYLLMSGPEPDNMWEAFATAVRAVIEHFSVRLTISMGAVPMAVPHTRPVMLTNHATSPDLLILENVWTGRIRVPSSAQALLEVRLGEWEHPAMGFVAHIPHYVAQFEYPSAAVAILESVGVVAGLSFDLRELEEAGEARMAEISTYLEDSDEVRQVVAGLEQQYDAFRGTQESDMLPLADEKRLPTGEEIGAEFERFLAGLDKPEE
jgi:predicted ATP-grasp superfamily ATP-dependent carboligase